MRSTAAPPSGQRPLPPVPPKEEEGIDSAKPKVRFDSRWVFFITFVARFVSAWTKKFALSLLTGQLVSLCLACATVTSNELVVRGWVLPITQTFFLYFSLFVVYTPYTIYKYGFAGWGKLILHDGWKYFILASCDVEGNFLAMRSYQYADPISLSLLYAWTIPSCTFFCWVLMRKKYLLSQFVGTLTCICGLGMLVGSNLLSGVILWQPVDEVKGDLFMVAGATLYGLNNAAEEFFVRQSPLYEVLGQLGMWGTLINAIQAAGLEHRDMKTSTWNGATGGLLVAWTAAMFIFYTMTPILYRMATSVFYNLNLLSTGFFGLLFGDDNTLRARTPDNHMGLQNYPPFPLYFVAYPVIIFGLTFYFWSTSPEYEGKVDPQIPSYIKTTNGEQTTPGNQA
ncbi:DUF914-domain-containing protein [Thelephora terrestris]|uniref:DUF914-domain-containing protein n=1 Tax=Thelephora terrestris TaxID=56493 RepID=A0A9P6H591_9AGAM|nr:DUF914-domain-containing protein [Thelephora terrestris]